MYWDKRDKIIAPMRLRHYQRKHTINSIYHQVVLRTMTEKQKDFWGRTGDCYFCQRSEMASLRMHHFCGGWNKERCVSGEQFPAEGWEGPWDPVYLACTRNRKEVRLAQWGTKWVALESQRQRGPRPHKSTENTLDFSLSVMEGQRKLLCRVWPWSGWQFRELQLRIFLGLTVQKVSPLKGHSHGSPRADFIIFRLFFFSWPHHMAYRILIPRPGKEPTPPAVREPCLTTGLSGMSPFSVLKLRLFKSSTSNTI